MNDDYALTRRTALRSSLGLATTVGLAGCSGLLGSGGGDGIEPGDTVETQLTTDAGRDPVYDDLAEAYTLTLDSSTTVSIGMRSEAFDTHLLLTQNGNSVAEDDDGGSGLDSNLVTTLDTGTYTVWAGSFSGSGTGSYTLSVSEVDPASEASPDSIQVGSTVDGQLTNGAARDPVRDDLARPYEVSLDSSTDVEVSLSSSDFDTYLVITQDGAEVATDDDGGSGLDSELVESLDAGTYTIWAGSFSGSSTGRFTLSVSEGGAQERTDPADVSPEPIELGTTVEGELTEDSPWASVYAGYADPYSVSLDSTTAVRISYTSDEIDPYLVVTRDGNVILENDDGGEGFNSEASPTLEPGTYTIWTGTYREETTGRYTLRLEEV